LNIIIIINHNIIISHQPSQMDEIPRIAGDLNIVKNIINSGVDINKKYGSRDITLLHRSCDNKWIHIVKYLVESNASIDQTDSNGWTPLHYAACNGYFDIFKYLVESCCDINARTRQSNTPLHFVVCSGKLEIVKYLLESYHGTVIVDHVNDYGKTAYDLAIERGCDMVAKYIKSYESMPTKGVHLDNE